MLFVQDCAFAVDLEGSLFCSWKLIDAEPEFDNMEKQSS